jgi:hypothetical protein
VKCGPEGSLNAQTSAVGLVTYIYICVFIKEKKL